MSRRTFILITAACALLILGFLAYKNRSTASKGVPAASQNATYECDGDGKLCPDGSVVGRQGPACEFSACPGEMPRIDDALSGTSILHGYVVLTPTCPTEQIPPNPLCAPKGYVTNIAAFDPEGRKIADTQTTSEGEYVLDVPPGTYLVRAQGGDTFPRCEDIEVVVEEGERRTLNISCDSGIR